MNHLFFFGKLIYTLLREKKKGYIWVLFLKKKKKINSYTEEHKDNDEVGDV